MSGWEQLVVWLSGFFTLAGMVRSAAKAFAAARVEVAKQHARAHVEAHRVVAEAQFGTLTVPREWQEDGL